MILSKLYAMRSEAATGLLECPNGSNPRNLMGTQSTQPTARVWCSLRATGWCV